MNLSEQSPVLYRANHRRSLAGSVASQTAVKPYLFWIVGTLSAGAILFFVFATLLFATGLSTYIHLNRRIAPEPDRQRMIVVVPRAPVISEIGAAQTSETSGIVVSTPAEAQPFVEPEPSVKSSEALRRAIERIRGSQQSEMLATTTEPQIDILITYRELFQQVAAQYGLDWRVLAALAYRESRLDPFAVGADQDLGLMQILPSTWLEFAPQIGAQDPYAPWESAQVGALYLIYLHDYLSSRGIDDFTWTLVAYNWGPENVRRLLESGGRWEDLPLRQQRYVADILRAAYGSSESQ